MSGMGERWLTRLARLARAPRAARAAGVLLVVAAFGQAVGQAVTLGFASAVHSPGPLAVLDAFPLCALALLSTVPLLLLRPPGAALLVVLANVLAVAVFSAPTVAGAVAAVLAAGRLGADGELRSLAGRGLGPAAAQYLAVGLAAPFLVLALVKHGNVACVLLASGVPMAAGAGIALRAGRAARTYTEAGEALADTLVAHTARGERARIARELHDVVAHHISMIAVQAETGRLTIPGLPEAGARRFLEIGDTARGGLTEMRRLLGVLREDAAEAASDPAVLPGSLERGSREPSASRQPQPGLAQVAELIDASREASAAGTRLIISGRVGPLDPGVELAAYRIVQEALTNARRHAQGAAVDVELRYGGDTLRLRVRDNGPGPAREGPAGGGTAASAGEPGVQPRSRDGGHESPSRDGGHGLPGMRERALSVGGALSTGAAPGGGFLVEAVLPAEPDPVRRSRASAEASR
jgi:signal transduction histidine kinase